MNPVIIQAIMIYKNYTASIEWLEDEQSYRGKVKDTWGTITFSGNTLDEAYQMFVEVLDYYLEDCEKNGEEPRLSNRELCAVDTMLGTF